MTGLQKPPQPDRPSRVLGRFVVLVILLVVVAITVWSAVTNQRIDLVETTEPESVEDGERVEVDGLDIHVEEGSGGPIPVVLLHGFDVSGGVSLQEVAAGISDMEARFRPVLIDLPGFGLSERIVEPGAAHTVGAMAGVVATIIDERYGFAVVVAGVGLGGEVAAELAVTHPELVRGLVMIDTDFWSERDWVRFVESLPYVGRAAIHTFEGNGRFGVDRWAPRCDEGGWCPTREQVAARELAASIAGTTDSLSAFLETPTSSLVPSELDSIMAPVVYVWSLDGPVPEESVEMIQSRLAGVSVIRVDAWKTHLESPASIIEAIDQVSP